MTEATTCYTNVHEITMITQEQQKWSSLIDMWTLLLTSTLASVRKECGLC